MGHTWLILVEKIAFFGDNFRHFSANFCETWNMDRYQPKVESIKRPIRMGDHGSRLTGFSQKIAFSDDNFAIFQPILMKLEMWLDINPKSSPLKGPYAWVTMGHAWLILVEKIAFFDDNFWQKLSHFLANLWNLKHR